MQKTFIGILIIIILVLIFALQNVQSVTIYLWFWRVEASLSLVLILSVTIGAILSYLMSVPRGVKNKKELKEKDKKIRDLEKKIPLMDQTYSEEKDDNKLKY
jgi:uncharacterized integral membrane protein